MVASLFVWKSLNLIVDILPHLLYNETVTI